jgi:hypothetical protein
MTDNIETQVFEIRVKAKRKLTDDEMFLVAKDFHMRLQGYTTECPKELIGAYIELMPIN